MLYIQSLTIPVRNLKLAQTLKENKRKMHRKNETLIGFLKFIPNVKATRHVFIAIFIQWPDVR